MNIYIALNRINERQQKLNTSQNKKRACVLCQSQPQLTCWLNVDAAGGSLHETRGHMVIRILLREPRVLVTHQPVLKLEMVLHSQDDYIITQMASCNTILALKILSQPQLQDQWHYRAETQ